MNQVNIVTKRDRELLKILGLSEEELSVDTLRKAYKKKALKYHPDKNKSKDSEDKFKELSNAYRELLKKFDKTLIKDLIEDNADELDEFDIFLYEVINEVGGDLDEMSRVIFERLKDSYDQMFTQVTMILDPDASFMEFMNELLPQPNKENPLPKLQIIDDAPYDSDEEPNEASAHLGTNTIQYDKPLKKKKKTKSFDLERSEEPKPADITSELEPNDSSDNESSVDVPLSDNELSESSSEENYVSLKKVNEPRELIHSKKVHKRTRQYSSDEEQPIVSRIRRTRRDRAKRGSEIDDLERSDSDEAKPRSEIDIPEETHKRFVKKNPQQPKKSKLITPSVKHNKGLHIRCKVLVSLEDLYYNYEKIVSIKTRRYGEYVIRDYRIEPATRVHIFPGKGDQKTDDDPPGDLIIETDLEPTKDYHLINTHDLVRIWKISLYEYIFTTELEVEVLGKFLKLKRDLDVHTEELVIIGPPKNTFTFPNRGLLKDSFTGERGDLIIKLAVLARSDTCLEMSENLFEFFPPLIRN